MRKVRITQIFPWLLPLRKKQRAFCFYAGMRVDGNRYANTLSSATFAYTLFTASCPLYNSKTGFPMIYQENKVFNLKLVAKQLDGLVLRPGETFSFWQRARGADRITPYKEGLVVKDGELQAAPGGGLCQMSNLLFWMFLHTPLKIVERHGHGIKDFPEPSRDTPKGVDATLSEGWMDLRVRNNTSNAFQIKISFDEENITGTVLSETKPEFFYKVENGDVCYTREQDGIYEEAAVLQRAVQADNGKWEVPRVLYVNRCRIGYPLPAETPVATSKTYTQGRSLRWINSI